LVVDDEAPVRRLVSTVVRGTGCDVAEAPDGEAALDILARGTFDLLITDLRMPRMDGLALLEECRVRYPSMDVVILTAYGTIQSAVQAIRLGTLDYIGKPFSSDDLAQRVRHCFEARRSRPQPISPVEPLVELSRILSSTVSASDVLESVVSLVQSTFTPTSIGLALFGDESQDDIALAVDILATDGARSTEDLGFPRPDRALVRDLAARDRPWVLRELGPIDVKDLTRTEGPALTVPLVSGSDAIGWMTLVRNPGAPAYTEADAQLLCVFSFQIAIAVLHARTHQRLVEAFRDLRRATLSTVHTLFATIQAFDPYTHDHCERVARYAYMLGRRLDLKAEELESIRIGALLHDLGKIGIGDDTVRKQGGLTSDEVDRVRLHPVLGAQILADMDAFAAIVPMVLHHHEHYDGSGYPAGLAGDEIPLGARIIAVVDAFDSMTTDRPYRRALSTQAALARLRAGAGTQLDPYLVTLWTDIVAEGGLANPGSAPSTLPDL